MLEKTLKRAFIFNLMRNKNLRTRITLDNESDWKRKWIGEDFLFIFIFLAVRAVTVGDWYSLF